MTAIKPLEINELNGYPGKRRRVKPIGVPRDRPDPPPHFTDEHLEVWHHFVDCVQGMGVMATVDATALEALVNSWCGYREAQAHIDEHGMVIAGHKDVPAVSPHFKVRKMLWDECMALMREFGLTPVARTRLANALVQQPTESDPLMEMLKKRQGN